jgi:hypothetical protein
VVAAVDAAASPDPGSKWEPRAAGVAGTAAGVEVAEDRDYACLTHQTFVFLRVEGAEGGYGVVAAVVAGG